MARYGELQVEEKSGMLEIKAFESICEVVKFVIAYNKKEIIAAE